jgi:hypothetical protein
MVADQVTGVDFTSTFRQWIAEHRAGLEARGIECGPGENPDSAGSDPVMWLDLFKGARGGRLALWRAGDVELEVADMDSGQVAPQHFALEGPEDIVPIIDRLLEWTEVNATGDGS